MRRKELDSKTQRTRKKHETEMKHRNMLYDIMRYRKKEIKKEQRERERESGEISGGVDGGGGWLVRP